MWCSRCSCSNSCSKFSHCGVTISVCIKMWLLNTISLFFPLFTPTSCFLPRKNSFSFFVLYTPLKYSSINVTMATLAQPLRLRHQADYIIWHCLVFSSVASRHIIYQHISHKWCQIWIFHVPSTYQLSKCCKRINLLKYVCIYDYNQYISIDEVGNEEADIVWR